jgi:release factor glutamine methyltransferase
VITDSSLTAAVFGGRLALERAGLPSDAAAIDAEVLAREALGWDRATYLARRHDPAPADFAASFERLIGRRALREPVSQILGRREFWGRDFEVTRDVLTPRPETELVVETALDTWPSGHPGPLRVADAGTGSGCLAVTIACEWPGARVQATDVSAAALAIAARNVARHGLADRITLLETDLLEAVAAPLDVIVANPPYVPDSARPVLPSDVRDYEPDEALYGGPTGFELIDRLLAQATSRLAPDGIMIMEFGEGRDDRLRASMARQPRLTLVAIREDLQQIPRVAVIRRAALR